MKRFLTIVILCLSSGFMWAQADSVIVRPSYNFDYQILRSIEDHRTPAATATLGVVTNSLSVAPFVPAAQAIYGWVADDKVVLRDAGESLTALGICGGITMGVKAIVNRPRPYVTYADSLHALRQVMSASFPSGHTSTTFCVATSLSLQYPHWYVAVPAYLWAGSVAFSRLYLGVHYPTDVATGMLVGVGSAVLAHYIRLRIDEATGMPASKGVVIPVMIRF